MQRRSLSAWRTCGALSLGLVLVAATDIASIAWAQNYPTKPVRIVVPFAPGGTTDILARLVGQRLSDALRQPVVIDNRPGANGALGTEFVAKSPPDGHTIVMGYLGAFAIGPNLYAKLPYDPIRDFAPITLVASTTQALVIHPSLPARSTRELIALAKRQPGQISYASAGIGAPSHLAGELFKMMAGIDMVHVPYRSVAAGLTDMLSGQVQVTFGTSASTLEYVRAGTLRALGVTTSTRSAAVPDLPAIAETVPGYEATAWFGVGAPRATPIDIVNKLSHEINACLADPTLQSRIADLGGITITGSPADFRKLILEETEKWAKVVKFSGAKAE
jgi:tripartite-type tricarboxylate transporter receptor subunit TctC